MLRFEVMCGRFMYTMQRALKCRKFALGVFDYGFVKPYAIWCLQVKLILSNVNSNSLKLGYFVAERAKVFKLCLVKYANLCWRTFERYVRNSAY